MILETHPRREGEQVGEAFLERFIAGDFARNIGDHAGRANAQKLERPPGQVELVHVGVPPDPDRGALGDAPVALPKRHLVAPRQFDQFFQGEMTQPRIGWMRDGFRLYRGVTTTRSRSRRQRSGLVRYRQAFLDQRHQLLLTQSLAPMRQ
jgi:hypothetical protein